MLADSSERLSFFKRGDAGGTRERKIIIAM